MKQKILLLLLGSLLSLPAMARDFSYTYEGQTLTYTVIDEEAKTCQTKEGDYNNEKAGNVVSGALIIPEKVNDGNSDYTVTYIGELAFYVCGDLTSVEIPNSVTSIGDDAFAGCGGLTSVVIPNSVTSIGFGAFQICSSLTSVLIGNSVTSIGGYAFWECRSLTSVLIGTSVTSIGEYAFSNCIGLKKSAYPNNIENPFPNGFAIGYNPEVAIIEDGVIYGPDKSSIIFASLSIEGEYVIPNLVTSIGYGAFYECSGLTSVVIPNSVTSIGAYAFDECSGLTSVLIGNSVTSIGEYAFYGCTGLIKSAYPKNLRNPFEKGLAVGYDPEGATIEDGFIYGPDKTSILFASLSMEGEYVIPKSVTSIGDAAFAYCGGLTSVEIPNSVTSISESAFADCGGLTSVIIPNTVTSIGKNAFSGCSGLTSVEIPNSVTSIGGSAFSVCLRLTSVVIPNSVTSIGSWAFGGCLGLTSVVMGNSVTSIGEYAFNDCSGLTSVVIPNSVTTIGKYAFQGCSGLTSVVIGNSVTSIGRYAFKDCSGLTSVVIPNSVTSIGDAAFWECRSLTSVLIGNSVTSIGKLAFNGCTSLIKSAYPNNLNNPFEDGYAVGYNPEGAFFEDGFIYGPEQTSILFAPFSLKDEYIIPNTVTSIGNSVFTGCSGLTSVEIPNSVTSIGDKAFDDCSGLTSVNVLAEKPASMMDDSFEGLYDEVTLSVPDAAVNAYLSTNWSFFKNIRNNDAEEDDAEIKTFTDGVLEYRINPANETATVIGAKDNSNLQIPERFTDDSDSSNPVRYYVKAIGYKAFDGKDVKSIEFNTRSQIEYIGDYAFANTSISSVNLPSTVKSIGNSAFYKTSKLNKAVLNSGLETVGEYAFAESAIAETVIPATVKSIGNYAFYKTSKLNKAVLNSGLETVGEYAFAESALAETVIPATVKSIGNYAFYKTRTLNKAVLNSGLETIGDYAFAESALNVLEMEADVKYIGEYAFYDTYSLKSISSSESGESNSFYINSEYIGAKAFATSRSRGGTISIYIGPSVKAIGKDAFENFNASEVRTGNLSDWYKIDFENGLANPLSTGNGKLYSNDQVVEKLQVPADIEEIKPYSFYGCKSLTEVIYPATLQSIGNESFYNCGNISAMTFEDGNSSIEISHYAFNESPKELNWSRPIESLTFDIANVSTLAIGNSITEIPDGIFKNLGKLTSLTLGSSIQTIGNEALSGCTSLKEVILPPSVETIGASAFAGDSRLASIIMGHNVKTIGEKAFDGCSANTVSITAQTPPTAPNNTFSNYSGKLYLQGETAMKAYYDAYTCWDRFNSYVMIDAEKINIDGVDKISGKPGDTFQLTASIWPENATLPYIFWRSTNPEIATVDANGLVTLHADLDEVLTRAQGDADIDGTCTIIAETLYNDGPVAQITVSNAGIDAVDSVAADGEGSIDYTRPYEVYNMSGLKVADSTEGLTTGLYIIRQGNAAVKTAVR